MPQCLNASHAVAFHLEPRPPARLSLSLSHWVNKVQIWDGFLQFIFRIGVIEDLRSLKWDLDSTRVSYFKHGNFALKINDSFGHGSLPCTCCLLFYNIHRSNLFHERSWIVFRLFCHAMSTMSSCLVVLSVDCFFLLMDTGHWSCKNQLLVNSGKKCRTDGWWWW